MAFGFEPTWFDSVFQINIGYKSIIASSKNDSPAVDKYVKGAEQFKTITEYDSTDRTELLYFKAMNWDGLEELYTLNRYSSSNEPLVTYEVIALGDNIQSEEFTWQAVNYRNCRSGLKRLQSFIFDYADD